MPQSITILTQKSLSPQVFFKIMPLEYGKSRAYILILLKNINSITVKYLTGARIMGSEKKELLKKPLRYLKGVGEARAALFHKLGIFTVGDIITHFPRNYEDRSSLKKIAELRMGKSVRLKV